MSYLQIANQKAICCSDSSKMCVWDPLKIIPFLTIQYCLKQTKLAKNGEFTHLQRYNKNLCCSKYFKSSAFLNNPSGMGYYNNISIEIPQVGYDENKI